jgi:hypothetical protein
LPIECGFEERDGVADAAAAAAAAAVIELPISPKKGYRRRKCTCNVLTIAIIQNDVSATTIDGKNEQASTRGKTWQHVAKQLRINHTNRQTKN